ncbi:MAG: lolA [Gemmatimonadetes bacterium]|nr:lolA [Gemmatimonadota bacterium]
MKFLLGLVAVSAFATWPAAAPQDDASVIVGRAARVYRSLASLRADFTQVIDDDAVGTFESRGIMVQSGQNKLTMRFSDPKGDAIVLDGRYVWVYTPSTTPGQVLRMPIPTGPVYGFNVLAWLLDKPAERYRSRYLKRDFVDFVQTDVVELVPMADDLPFRKATLWLDRDTALPRKVVIEERAGGTRTLTLSKLRTNDPVTDKTFQFDVPSGVRVIEQS